MWEKNFFSSASFPTPNLSNSNLRPVYSLAPSAPLLSLNPPRPDLDYTSSRLLVSSSRVLETPVQPLRVCVTVPGLPDHSFPWARCLEDKATREAGPGSSTQGLFR